MRNKKFLKSLAILTLSVATTGSISLFGCAHKHKYSDEWKYDDESGHYRIATCHDVRTEVEPHDYTDKTDPDCNVCGYIREIKEEPPVTPTHSHAYSDFKSDDEKHWKECTATGCTDAAGKKYEEGEHSWIDSATAADKQVCLVCQKERSKPQAAVATLFALDSDSLASITFAAETPANWDEGELVKLHSATGKLWSYEKGSSTSGEVKDSSGTVVKTTEGRLKSNGNQPYIMIDLSKYLGNAKITLSFASSADSERTLTFAENVSGAEPIHTETTSDKTARFVTKGITGGKVYKISFTGAFNFYGIVIEYAEGEFGLKTNDEGLNAKKTEAKAALDSYKNESEYTKKLAELKAEIKKGKDAIDSAYSEADVAEELEKAKAEIDKIKSDAQIAADEAAALAAKKTEAKATLTDYKKAQIEAIDSSINAEVLANIATKKSEGAAAIDAATTIDGVESALENAKLEVNTLVASTSSLANLQQEVTDTLRDYADDEKAKLPENSSARDKIEAVVTKYNTEQTGLFYAEDVTNANIYTILEAAKKEIDDIVLWETAPDEYIAAKNPDKTLVRLDKDKAVDTKLTAKAHDEAPGIFMSSEKPTLCEKEYIKVINESGIKAYQQVNITVDSNNKPAKAETNIFTDIVVGRTKGKVEGYFEFSISAVSSGQQPIRFLGVEGSVVLMIGEVNGALYYTTDNSVTKTTIEALTLAKDTYMRVHFVFENGKLAVNINGKEAFKDVAISSLGCVRLASSNSSLRLITARRIIVVGTALTLEEKIDAKLNQLKAVFDSYDTANEQNTKYDTTGKGELQTAYNNGKAALEALKTDETRTLEKMVEAYTTAVNAMKDVKTADENTLIAYKKAAVEVINAINLTADQSAMLKPEKKTEVEAEIARLKGVHVANINAVVLGAGTLDAAKALVDAAKTAGNEAIKKYIGQNTRTPAESIAYEKGELDKYATAQIATKISSLSDTDKETVKGLVNTAIADVLSAQKTLLDGSDGIDALNANVATAKTAIDTAINAKFNENITLTLNDGTKDHTQTVKFATVITTEKLHVTAYNVSQVKYNNEPIAESGMLITEAKTFSVTLAEIQNYVPSLSWRPEAAGLPSENSLIAFTSEKYTQNGYLGTATGTFGTDKLTGAWMSDNITANDPSKNTTEDNGVIFKVTAKENLKSLVLYIGLGDSSAGGRQGVIHVLKNKQEVDKNEKPASKAFITLKTVLSNLVVGDEITVYVSELSSGSKLYLFGIDASIDETKVDKNVSVTWGTDEAKLHAYYEAINKPKTDPTDGDKKFLGWYYTPSGGSETKFVDGTKFSSNSTIIMTPKFLEANAKITYKVEGQTDKPDEFAVVPGTQGVTCREKDPTKEGHRFVGWYNVNEQNEFTTPFDFNAVVGGETSMQEYVAVAKFVPNDTWSGTASVTTTDVKLADFAAKAGSLTSNTKIGANDFDFLTMSTSDKNVYKSSDKCLSVQPVGGINPVFTFSTAAANTILSMDYANNNNSRMIIIKCQDKEVYNKSSTDWKSNGKFVLKDPGNYTIEFTGGEHKINNLSLTSSATATETITGVVNSISATKAENITTATEVSGILSEVKVNITGTSDNIKDKVRDEVITSGYTVIVVNSENQEVTSLATAGSYKVYVIYGSNKTLADAHKYNSASYDITVTAAPAAE